MDGGVDVTPDLIVIGPLKSEKLAKVMEAIDSNIAVIFCAPTGNKDFDPFRKRYPRLLHVPLREDWAQVVLLWPENLCDARKH